MARRPRLLILRTDWKLWPTKVLGLMVSLTMKRKISVTTLIQAKAMNSIIILRAGRLF